MASAAEHDGSGDKRVVYIDSAGHVTTDPAHAVSGEVAEYDAHGRPVRRTRFFLDRVDIPWLPVSEPAFLLWVLAALFVVWVCIGLVLTLG